MRAGIAAGGGAALPAPVFNMKKRFDYRCVLSGERRSIVAGRMECTMQARAHLAASRASPDSCGALIGKWFLQTTVGWQLQFGCLQG